MNQSWGHAYSILIFSRQAKVSWLARFLPKASDQRLTVSGWITIHFHKFNLCACMLNIFVKLSTFDSHNQQKQNNQILHHHISKMRNSHIRIDSYVCFVDVWNQNTNQTLAKRLWRNPVDNVTFLVFILATLGIEPVTPRIGIKCSKLSAVRHFINQ